MNVVPDRAAGRTSPRAARWAPWVEWGAASGAAATGVAAMFLGLYRARGFRLPVGFDAPWYVWRGRFVSARGLGSLGTSARPGHEVLAAVLGAVTRRGQLELAVLLPPVLAAAFALALGALLWSALGPDGRRWLVAVALGGTILGGTRLVDENVATLLFLAVLVAALVPLVEHAAGSRARPTRPARWRRPPFWGAMALLVAAGLAHWLFLAVFAPMLAMAVALLLPAALRERAAGRPFAETDVGALATVGAAVAVTMAVLIGAVLRAPIDTIEVKEDPARFLPKLRTDALRLFVPGLAPVAVGGAAALAVRGDRPGRRVLLALLAGWTVVSLGGIAYGAATLKLPPHRFLELLIVVPGVAAVAEAVVWTASRVRRRMGGAGPRVGWALAIVAAGALVVPGTLAWYRSGGPQVWIDAAAFRQARTASAYVASLRADQPFVVLVSPFGTAGALSVPLKERTIRMALPADREASLHVFPGEPGDALAGRRTLAPGAAVNAATLPYWQDVRTVLPNDPPIVILQAFAPKEFRSAVATMSSAVVGPGVAVLRGPAAPAPLAAGPGPDAFPGIRAAIAWTVVVLALLFAAGAGWTGLFLGRGVRPAVLFGSAPAVGAGMLILGGVLVSRAGVGLGGAAGVATYAVVTVAGAASWVAGRPRGTDPGSLPP